MLVITTVFTNKVPYSVHCLSSRCAADATPVTSARAYTDGGVVFGYQFAARLITKLQ